MRVHLVAVQTTLQREPYAQPEAFRRYVLELTRRATQGLPEGEPRLVAFPEAFGLPLLFWLEAPLEAQQAPTTLQAALRLLRACWPAALRLGVLSPAVFYHLRAPQVWPLYQQAFAEAAQAFQAYIVAGSLFSPLMDFEPARGLHPQGPKAYNLSLFFSPKGRLLGRIPKMRLTPHERRAFLSPGPPGRQILETHLGRISVLICLDAFHDDLIEQADAAGAWLVVQPSANPARWEGPWSGDPSQIEGEVWLREGLARKLLDRENLRYGLNPMLNGDLYELHFEGRSGVYQAGGPLALAESPLGEALVRATVEVEP
ncbi:MAG: nitrilase [Meiothermus sp.]|uniref:nitrilase-related carbon-nitrogen hydrolase n=1 Tax=Meiothermus sp. TaxID=1955249 RepID=UPI0025DA27C5|nr:nitrilase-related carbon-nitrogen hydrolase [Meiothermus sp.]MCS7193734.1 nitrilase [Meiothermus sp.]MCX7740021.1 nitrilase [Meiothermus sp.]MDW8089911.1 nitrilase-related carbon-nitrogen hydrolase [Meiothermus sp.]MDW8481663.1 nitrilase-related carbon-nitrogen hydrolase [Meiothermus sp.]